MVDSMVHEKNSQMISLLKQYDSMDRVFDEHYSTFKIKKKIFLI
jgi:hypothetical protein